MSKGKRPNREDADATEPEPETGGGSNVDASAEEIATLRARAQERDSLLDQLQRSRAEFANYQKRVERDRDVSAQEAQARVLARVIPLLDDVVRALRAARETKDLSSIERGLGMMERSFEGFLAELGVKPIESVGKPFDPRQHEAVDQRESDEFPEGTVMSELQRGYLVGGRVLRPAQVVISKGAPRSRDVERDESAEESES